MSVDPFSPVAPVRLRALLLPIGKIKRSRFLGFAKRLQSQNVVRLGDVSPDGRTSRSMCKAICYSVFDERLSRDPQLTFGADVHPDTFSPLAFPSGMVIYDLSVSTPATPVLDTFPFETFREPLVILAIADGAELSAEDAPQHGKPNGTARGNDNRPSGLDEVTRDLAVLQDNYPRSLVRQLLVFDSDGVDSLWTDHEGITWVPPVEISRSTTIKTVMCDVTASALKGLGSFAQEMDEWSTIDAPRASSWEAHSTSDFRPAGKLQHRMTMPAQLPSRPNGSPNPTSDPSSHRGGQESPTTFDQITRSIQRSSRAETLKAPSNSSSNEHSRERKPVSGGGPANPNDRAKNRASGRLNVVVGSLYLQTGLWPDAIKELAEGATAARSGSDYIWHAKALEAMLLCMLMFGWAGMDFQVSWTCRRFTLGAVFCQVLTLLSHRSLKSVILHWKSPLRNQLRVAPTATHRATKTQSNVPPPCNLL